MVIGDLPWGEPAYKGFHLIDDALVCDQYSNPTEYHKDEVFTVEGPVTLCSHGIHICLEPLDCLRYYTPNNPLSVIGFVEARGIDNEQQDGWSTKRVCTQIKPRSVLTCNYSWETLIDEVRNRTKHTKYGWEPTNPCANELTAGHFKNPCPDEKVFLVGGWQLGQTKGHVAMSAGNYSVVGSEYKVVDIAMTFGRGSVANGCDSFAFGPYSIARARRPGGIGYTDYVASIAVAEWQASLAVASHTESRAIANCMLSAAIAMTDNSTVILNSTGALGVTAGSAVVKAHGCAVVFLSWSHKWGPGEWLSNYGPSPRGTVIGPEGTLLMFLDTDGSQEWMTCRLKKDDPNFPADVELDVEVLYERLRRKTYRDENNLG